jgi:hypothetical protein
MNSPTIQMEKSAAAAKLEEYEKAMEKNPKLATQIDRDVMRGYKLLAKGARLVDVNEAIRHGGLNLAGLPKLAISRAHVASVRFSRTSDLAAYLWHDHAPRYRWSGNWYTSDTYRWVLPDNVFPWDKKDHREVMALTPLIPLPIRPARSLHNYFLLWEANWHPAPPRDPYLLQQVTGSLMEIVAEWDVSDLELAAVSAAMQKAARS